MTEKNQKTVEVGHTYLHQIEKNNSGCPPELAVLAAIAVLSKEEHDSELSYLFLVDDFHQDGSGVSNHPPFEASEDNLKWLREQSITQEVLGVFSKANIQPELISELLMAPLALLLYTQLKHRGVVHLKNPSKLAPQYGNNISLLTRGGQPTCELIDAAFYIEKIGPQFNRPTITFLPEFYKSQQKKTRLILAALGIKTPPITIYFLSDEGEVTEIEDWSKNETI